MGLIGVCNTCNRNLTNFYFLRFVKKLNMEIYIKDIHCLGCRIGILLNLPADFNFPKTPKDETDSENVIFS